METDHEGEVTPSRFTAHALANLLAVLRDLNLRRAQASLTEPPDPDEGARELSDPRP